jgi:hypothetical protein
MIKTIKESAFSLNYSLNHFYYLLLFKSIIPMNSKEIFNYIQATGYNLSSEKILKEPESNHQTIWEIIVHLCNRVKNKNRDSNFATYTYLIEDPEKHQLSCKWVR